MGLHYSGLFSPSLCGNTGISRGRNLDPSWDQICPYDTSGLPGTPVCDLSSAHTTNTFGASVSLAFYGRYKLVFVFLEYSNYLCFGGCYGSDIQLLCVTKGQSVQLFGNATGGMGYEVSVDGLVSTREESSAIGQVLASVSGLKTGYHNVTLVARPPASPNNAILLFERAVVTVGTGLVR